MTSDSDASDDKVQYKDDGTPTKETIKRAMKAFRKRIKLMRLDEESRIGRNPLSHGEHSTIFAIRPPDQYPIELWDKLVEMGRLRRDRNGLYEIVEADA